MRRGRLVLIVGLVLAGVLAAAVALAVAGGSDDEALLPDLNQASPGELSGRTLSLRDGKSFFLGFESAAGNVGDGPLIIVGSRPSRQQQRMKLVQRIRSEDGSTPNRVVPAELQYVARPTTSTGTCSTSCATSYAARTASSSLARPQDRLLPRRPLRGPTPARTCRAGADLHRGVRPESPGLLRLREGISVGYGDDYDAHLEGQSFDVTGLPAGRYLLVHRVNSGRVLRESDYSNNASSMAFELAWPNGKTNPPRIDVIARCPDTATCG